MVVLLLVVAAWAGSWKLIANLELPPPDNWNDLSNFGEMFGAVNALFSGLAFGGVIVALWMQREELRLQRQELADTRAELARTAAAQEQTSALIAEQLRIARAAMHPELQFVRAIPADVAFLEVEIRNHGGVMYNVAGRTEGNHTAWMSQGGEILPRGHNARLRVRPAPTSPIEVELWFINALGQARCV